MGQKNNGCQQLKKVKKKNWVYIQFIGSFPEITISQDNISKYDYHYLDIRLAAV